MAVYHVTMVIMTYSRWPVSTLVTIEYNKELLFPAVTVCNINPIRRSALSSESTKEIEKIIKQKVRTLTNIYTNAHAHSH